MNVELIQMFIRQHIKLTAAVGLGTGVLSAFLVALFPDMSSSDAVVIAESWPSLAKDIFGEPLLGFCEIHGWANLQVFHITSWVIYSGLAALLTSCVVAKEIENKTLDVLLSCPVSRAEIVMSRMVAVLVLLGFAVLPLFAGTGFGMLLAKQPPHLSLIFGASIHVLLLAFVGGTLTLLFTIIVPKRIPCIIATIVVFFTSFFFEAVLVPLLPFLKRFSCLNLFHFYEADYILLEGTFIWTAPLVLGLAGILFILVALSLFYRRDIPL